MGITSSRKPRPMSVIRRSSVHCAHRGHCCSPSVSLGVGKGFALFMARSPAPAWPQHRADASEVMLMKRCTAVLSRDCRDKTLPDSRRPAQARPQHGRSHTPLNVPASHASPLCLAIPREGSFKQYPPPTCLDTQWASWAESWAVRPQLTPEREGSP